MVKGKEPLTETTKILYYHCISKIKLQIDDMLITRCEIILFNNVILVHVLLLMAYF